MSTVLSDERITAPNNITRRLTASIIGNDNDIPETAFYTVPVRYIKKISWSIQSQGHAVLQWQSTGDIIFRLTGSGTMDLDNTDYIHAPSGSDVLWFSSSEANNHDSITLMITSKI